MFEKGHADFVMGSISENRRVESSQRILHDVRDKQGKNNVSRGVLKNYIK